MVEIADRYPISRVERVVDRFIRGEIAGQSLEFPPKPPQWAQALKQERPLPGEDGYETPEAYRSRLAREMRIEPVRRDPEERKRMLARLEDFRRASAEARLGHGN